MTPTMTLEVGETIEPGQALVMDSSTGRVYKLKMDRRGSILGYATEKLYAYDVIRLVVGSYSQWELLRDDNGEVIVSESKHSPRRQQLQNKSSDSGEISSMVDDEINFLRTELEGKIANYLVHIQQKAAWEKDLSLDDNVRAAHKRHRLLMEARVIALRKALRGLE